MFAFEVDPNWYEKYWLSPSPLPNRRGLARRLARVALVVVLIGGGGAMLSHFNHGHAMSDYPASQQE